MQVFVQHVGRNNLRHIDDTVTQRRQITEILQHIPDSAPEREFFEKADGLAKSFPDGTFNCWALPSRAKARWREMSIGDAVLLVPSIGKHGDGVQYLGVVKEMCPVESHEASRTLWPHPDAPGRLYPYLFFFETETGFREWSQFLKELSFAPNYNPRGYFFKLKDDRFDPWGGTESYLSTLRSEGGFKLIAPSTSVHESQLQYDSITPTEPARTTAEVTRFVRDSTLVKRLKLLHQYQCQICGYYIQLPNGDRYAEAHHIRPMGGVHKGPDVEENILILCPNHHAECDLGAIKLDLEKIRLHPDHRIAASYVEYHNQNRYGR